MHHAALVHVGHGSRFFSVGMGLRRGVRRKEVIGAYKHKRNQSHIMWYNSLLVFFFFVLLHYILSYFWEIQGGGGNPFKPPQSPLMVIYLYLYIKYISTKYRSLCYLTVLCNSCWEWPDVLILVYILMPQWHILRRTNAIKLSARILFKWHHIKQIISIHMEKINFCINWWIDWIEFYAVSAITQPCYSSKSSETAFCVPRGLLSLTRGTI